MASRGKRKGKQKIGRRPAETPRKPGEEVEFLIAKGHY